VPDRYDPPKISWQGIGVMLVLLAYVAAFWAALIWLVVRFVT
jgi:hypothetical protein